MTGSELSLYHELARHYDDLYSWKDYRHEAQRLEEIARRFSASGTASWLDVACGTGRHLEYLRRGRSVAGVDASSEMLRVARHRLPGVRLLRGDMRSFRLGRRFDVVSCLFSAIGHLPTETDVRTAFANFARHLKVGGVAIVEPWIEPSDYRTGSIDLRAYQTPEVAFVRCSSSSHRRNHSVTHYHYLVGKRGRGFRYFEEKDVGLMVDRNRLLELMRGVGFRPRFLARGFTGRRGLLVGTYSGV